MTNDARARARRAISLVDLTELGDHATDDDVRALCKRAVGPYGTVAAVCVWPRHVELAAAALAGTPVRVATVVNFPKGDDPIDDVVQLVLEALADGADEIDLVLPYRAFIAGDTAHAASMVGAVRGVVDAGARKTLKVILETGELADPQLIAAAAELAIRNGADFVKTSTGKSPISATLAATDVMLRTIKAIDPAVGLKPSGGIRTAADADEYLAQADRIMGPDWVSPATFRFGASGLLTALEAAARGDSSVRSEEAY